MVFPQIHTIKSHKIKQISTHFSTDDAVNITSHKHTRITRNKTNNALCSAHNNGTFKKEQNQLHNTTEACRKK